MPPAGDFPAKESHQSSPGPRPRTPIGPGGAGVFGPRQDRSGSWLDVPGCKSCPRLPPLGMITGKTCRRLRFSALGRAARWGRNHRPGWLRQAVEKAKVHARRETSLAWEKALGRVLPPAGVRALRVRRSGLHPIEKMLAFLRSVSRFLDTLRRGLETEGVSKPRRLFHAGRTPI